MPKRPSPTRPTARRRGDSPREPAAPLVIITGLSGSGKGSVLRTLEDVGYYCVDNLPVALIPAFVDLYGRGSGEVERAALVVDIRGGEDIDKLPSLFGSLRQRLPVTLVFVEAGDDALLRRFSETRRPHPLGADLPLRDGVRRERRLLKPIRRQADLVIDTSLFTPHDLRQYIAGRFGRGDQRRPLIISLLSFGYRFGLPPEADLVFDVRFLPNPNFVSRYKPLTGKHPRVADYVLSFPQTREFVLRIVRLLDYLIPHYVREGKSYLTIGFGCTGGRHRSVAIVRAVAEQLGGMPHRIKISDRDLTKPS